MTLTLLRISHGHWVAEQWTIVQISRHGPYQVLSPDGTVLATGADIELALDALAALQ